MAKQEGEPKPRVGRGKGGGPKTIEGKKNSSQNSTKHGLCSSNTLVLEGEDPAELETIRQGWREEYQPEGHAENTLVDQVISEEWALRRAKRRVMWAEEQAMKNWTEETAHHLELMQRYKTAAERSFYRAWNAVQSLRKERLRMLEKQQKTEENLRELASRLDKIEKRMKPVAATPYVSATRLAPSSGASGQKSGLQSVSACPGKLSGIGRKRLFHATDQLFAIDE